MRRRSLPRATPSVLSRSAAVRSPERTATSADFAARSTGTACPTTFADPNALPANFFNVNSPRGAVFSTPGHRLPRECERRRSRAHLFGFPSDFQAFSPQKLFTAVNSHDHRRQSSSCLARPPPATTSAFGVIFVDVEVAGLTKLEFFDPANNLIFTRERSGRGQPRA